MFDRFFGKALLLGAVVLGGGVTFGGDGVFKVAFGSCGSQEHPLPIFDEVVKQKPDVFVFLGDNIYGDTDDMGVLRAKYAKLGAKPTFQRLKAAVPLIATWDDHDYGRDDAGKEYPFKVESKGVMLDFFDEPKDSERREREGIYQDYRYEVDGKVVQVILLDVRTFLDERVRAQGKSPFFYRVPYGIQTDVTKSILGEVQWKWLGEKLREPADFRLIGTGSQFGISYNGYEAWPNFPHEVERMKKLVLDTKAERVVFLTGDVHYGEVSKLANPGGYPLYDFTSSGLSSTWKFACPNTNRIEGPIMENHFGLLTIDFGAGKVKGELWDVTGNQRVEYTIPFGDIEF